MHYEEPMEDELRRRRAEVFRRMREEQRERYREAMAAMDERLATGIPLRKRSTLETFFSTTFGILGPAFVLKFGPDIAERMALPETLVEAVLFVVLGALLGASTANENWEERVETAALFGVLYGILALLLSLIESKFF